MTRAFLNTAFTILLALPFVLTAAGDEPAPAAEEKTELSSEQTAFVRDKVLPLLEARCFECHKQTKEPKGGLLLSSRRAMLSGGDSGPAIVPGKPDESLLIEAVRYEGFEMPPRSRLPQAEVAILERWVADGAPWPADLDTAPVATPRESFPMEERRRSHWAWQPIASSVPPQVTEESWIKTPVDAFVLSRLESAQLSPAEDVDRYTLIRRLYFDLIGLPPTVEQIQAFAQDPAEDDRAIETVVDDLLESPHFGERWGRHWLDLVRYAETLGHEFDYPLHYASQYRDYVIRAFNEDVPYDQFVKEHIAGDLLKNPRLHPTLRFNESVIGTGFWFLSEDKHAPVDVRGEEAARIDNQIDVFSKTFLGMTVACARCHDHKFDAISTKDYYALAGFLQSSRRQTKWLDPEQKISDRIQQLTEARNRAAELVQDAKFPAMSSEHLSRYVLAALEVIHGEPTPAEKDLNREIVFEDFESDSFEGWQVSGDAFAEGPAVGGYPGQQKVSGYAGQRLANSWLRNDNLKGRLRSRDFRIELPAISFLIGGGAFAGEACLNLVLDDKVVRSATGHNNERLIPASWDVSELIGKTAHLEIVDERTGGWGHINVDHIVFADDRIPEGTRRDSKTVARETECDPELLRRWVEVLLRQPHESIETPLSLPATLARNHDAAQSWLRQVRTSQKVSEEATTAFSDLRHGLPDDWFTEGQAFAGTGSNDEVRLAWRKDGLFVGSGGGCSSAALSKELRGTLASPTFELKHPEILIRVAGQGTRVRLVIDGYVMHEFSGLLFGGAKQPIETDGEFRWIRMAGDVHRYQGHRMHLEFLDEGNGWFEVQEIRFANRPGAAPPAEHPALLNQQVAAQLEQQDDSAELTTAIDAWADVLSQDHQTLSSVLTGYNLLPSEAGSTWGRIVAEWQSLATHIPEPLPVLAMMDGTGENEHVFIRGNHRNLGETAERMILTALAGEESPQINSGSGRLELAEQLLADTNPLPSRVAVNRIWHHLFGRGIVASTDNFGVLGKLPTHPALLDYLAFRFRTDGWSVKHLIRLIVTSHTYRMSANSSEAARQKDPANDFFHCANVRRLQGEAVRDAILAVSGQLDPAQFGAPVPVHLTPFMQGRGRPKADGPVDGRGRRSIYLSVNRNFLSPFMQAFDVPAPVTTIGTRTISNVPAQALIMLNNEFVNQQARIWAEKLIAAGPESSEALLDRAWFELYGRPPEPQDLEPLVSFLGPPADDSLADVETLTQICHALMNSKEFLFLR